MLAPRSTSSIHNHEIQPGSGWISWFVVWIDS